MEEGQRKYFIQIGNYPLPKEGLIDLKLWAENLHIANEFEFDNFYSESEAGINNIRRIFSHDMLTPVRIEKYYGRTNSRRYGFLGHCEWDLSENIFNEFFDISIFEIFAIEKIF